MKRDEAYFIKNQQQNSKGITLYIWTAQGVKSPHFEIN